MSEPLTEREIRALASCLHDETPARLLLARAGLDPAVQPGWRGSSLAFWREVSSEVGKGLVADGRRRIIAEASEEFPGNPVFAWAASPVPAGRRPVPRPTARPASAAPSATAPGRRATVPPVPALIVAGTVVVVVAVVLAFVVPGLLDASTPRGLAAGGPSGTSTASATTKSTSTATGSTATASVAPFQRLVRSVTGSSGAYQVEVTSVTTPQGMDVTDVGVTVTNSGTTTIALYDGDAILVEADGTSLSASQFDRLEVPVGVPIKTVLKFAGAVSPTATQITAVGWSEFFGADAGDADLYAKGIALRAAP